MMLTVARRLQRDHGFHPIYWSASTDHQAALLEQFPDVLFHDFFDAIRGEYPQFFDLQQGFALLSEEVLSEYSDIEKTFIDLSMTRADPSGGFKYYELTNYFHRALAASLSFIKKYQPDVWVSLSPPHSMFDYVFYEVCRKKQIKTVILFETSLPGYSFAVEEINYQHKRLDVEISRIKKTGFDEQGIPEKVMGYIQGIRKTYDDGKPFHFQINYPGDSGLSRHSFERIRTELHRQKKQCLKQYWLERLSPFKKLSTRKHYLKQSHHKLIASFTSELDWLRCKLDSVKQTQEIFDEYVHLSSEYVMDREYVYFPLHMQPECTTVPQGGVFADQLLSLRMLRAALPDEVFIYVKETPGQFRWHRGISARYRWMYQEMADMKNVVLLPTDTDPFALVDNSQCVFSITGTSGWESIVRGKPVISMGKLFFYKGFPGVYQVSSAEEIDTAMNSIQENPAVDFNEVLIAVQALINLCAVCSVQKKYVELYDIPIEENIDRLVGLLSSETM